MEREWVEVQCRGYESKRVGPRSSLDSTVVVPLKPLTKIIGRVVSNGHLVPMAKIELAGGSYKMVSLQTLTTFPQTFPASTRP